MASKDRISSFPTARRRVASLQESSRNANPIATYLLPFALGLLAGSALVFVGHYLQCQVGLWTCLEEREVLVQVAPALARSYSPQEVREVRGNPDDGDHIIVKGETEEGETDKQEPAESVSYNSTKTRQRTKPRSHNTSSRGPASSSSSKCPSRPLHLIILVLSSPSSSLRRTAIRGTWVHDYRERVVKVTTRFLLGTVGLDADKMADIGKEQEMFGDVLLLKDLKDSYTNLSAKVLLGLRWADGQSSEFDYLLKVDDDSYVRVESVANALHALNCDPRLYWGYFMGHAFPEETGKWAEHKWFLCPHYLPYAMGGGYVLSRLLVSMLVRVSSRLTLYNNEDVTVGSWLAPYRLSRLHDVRFNVESQSHGCNNGYLVSHKERVRTFYTKYTSLTRNGTLCAEEREIHPAYIYNWTVSPLNCCERARGIPVM